MYSFMSADKANILLTINQINTSFLATLKAPLCSLITIPSLPDFIMISFMCFFMVFITQVSISKHYNLDLHILNLICPHYWKERYKKINYNSRDRCN